jgi:hypothetical protein
MKPIRAILVVYIAPTKDRGLIATAAHRAIELALANGWQPPVQAG